jgi:hypothetical protein
MAVAAVLIIVSSTWHSGIGNPACRETEREGAFSILAARTATVRRLDRSREMSRF